MGCAGISTDARRFKRRNEMRLRVLIAFLLLGTTAALAQMPAMQAGPMNAAGMSLMNSMSGTAVNPEAWPMPMRVETFGGWTAMSMGQAFVVDTQESAFQIAHNCPQPASNVLSCQDACLRGRWTWSGCG
jgi:hypothetical protein